MQTKLRKILLGLIVSAPMLGTTAYAWQTPAAAQMQGRVVDAKGVPVAGAQVLDAGGHVLATSGQDGEFSIPAAVRVIDVEATHFAPATVTISAGSPLRVVLERPLETVVVTAYRSPLAAGDSPVSTRVLDAEKLQQAAVPALDGRLRQTPGFELFRRSSSLVANPTTEGVSLRGLGSTAASRSLVTFDDVPLNDPYGGWIHWEELPELAIHSVELVRGGASDLYGSSAIGGVISIRPVRPETNSLTLLSSYGGEATTDNAVLGTATRGAWSGLFSAGVIATNGYILLAPDVRGPVDRTNNVHAQNGLAEIDRKIGNGGRLFLRGNVLNETRHNGTILTGNGIRLWRYAAGMDWSHVTLRLYGDSEHYWQTFSSVAAGRVSEKLTRYAEDPAGELGASAQWHQPVGAHGLVLVGADTHDVRASDNELLYSGAGGTMNTTARQRQTGVYAEALFTPSKWTFSAAGRVDHFSNFDAHQYSSSAAPVVLPEFSETVFNPRVGITRRINPSLALNASAFRAYRAPTENELYRTGQVGQKITQANPNLRSERATGWETGFQTDLRKWGSSVRVSYFWTRVNRPITALTLSTTPTSALLKRENLGRIESRGVSLDYAAAPARWISIEGGYQYADATVTQFAQEPDLVGNWIPQVARNMATAQVRLTHPRWGLLSFQERASGHQFDDDANLYLLHSYFRTDVYASHQFGPHVTFFAAAENLFDRSIDVGRTPLLTQGTPLVGRFGLRLNLGE